MWDILLSDMQSQRNLFADVIEIVPAGKEGQIIVYTGSQITQVKKNEADRTGFRRQHRMWYLYILVMLILKSAKTSSVITLALYFNYKGRLCSTWCW